MKNYLKSIALMFTATLFVACGSDDPVTDDKETDGGKEWYGFRLRGRGRWNR